MKMAKITTNPNFHSTISVTNTATPIDVNCKSPFDDFAQIRGRSTRAASLAIPNTPLVDLFDQYKQPGQFLLAPPSASTINIRRHSSHHCPQIDDINQGKVTTSAQTINLQLNVQQPPPIPKRTYQGKLHSASKHPTTDNQTKSISSDSVKRRNSKRSSRRSQNRKQESSAYRSITDQSSDDDRLSIESNVFEDSSQTVIERNNFYNTSKRFIDSNRSSSDSNKSHTTIDTGYVSNDNERIFFNASEDFRCRFSSVDTVDTQSSIDSCINSPSTLTLRKEVDSDNEKLIGLYKSSTINGPTALKPKETRALPAVPMRRQTSVPKLPPPITKAPSATRSRGIPPLPPARSQASIESAKMVTDGQVALGGPGIKLTNLNRDQQELLSKQIPLRNNKYKGPVQSNNQIHHTKKNIRQDSNISSDSYSLTSSPGYNTKSMEAPLLAHASRINKSFGIRHQDSTDSFGMTTRYPFTPTGKFNARQDSTVSSDSFSQTSSPGYNTKLMEAPLLAHAAKFHAFKQNLKGVDEITKEIINDCSPNNVITKSASTPASLQTIVRFQNGSNMSLQHKILNRRKSSNPYVTQGRLKFRMLQILLNALALLIIAGGLAAYFKAYPTIKFVNKTYIIPPIPSYEPNDMTALLGKNPSPGVCLPIIVKFCQKSQIPYNYTIFPNYIGHFNQYETEDELAAFEALVDVKCYDLVSLFLCSLFVPKCGPTGKLVPPCKGLCMETMRRCGFFIDVFGLELPEYFKCSILSASENPDVCIGGKEVRDLRNRTVPPTCSGFACDKNSRCIPTDWRCDGHVDCQDQSDESHCDACGRGAIYCGNKKCMSQKHICDGVVDCPFGQDERNCVRLSERNGDLGKGILEIWKPSVNQWTSACVTNWDQSTSPANVCTMLGYSSVNSSRLVFRETNQTVITSNGDTSAKWRMYQRKHSNLLKEFASCPVSDNYPVVDITCSNFECGKIRNRRVRPKSRIVGGTVAEPGDWPFLAAILGGPEKIFYCAGVLIADQWVLTASHCIGNHTIRNIDDWTIQLGITRRHSYTYYGLKVKVINVIPHPQYNTDIMHDNDIALFQLRTRVAFHEHLLPVCLPPPGMRELEAGTSCTVIGWGKREEKKESASYEPTVNEVQVPVLNRSICNDWLTQSNVTDGMICAGYKEGGKDACQGDSGGPLLCRDPTDHERWFVGGIVSWGVKCAHPKLPGVYANVPKYIPWIMQQMHKYTTPRNTYENNNNY